MIVRIMGEGQFELPDGAMDRLNELDDALEAALDEPLGFTPALRALLESVRESGRKVADDELVESEVILPAEESTVDEVRAMLTDEGLIPD
jgi:hypothetical protein